MLTFVLISLLLGMVLGHHFKVLVLLPAIAIVMLALICTQIAGADRWQTAIAASVVLQLGYMAGYGIRRITAAARARRRRAYSVSRSQLEQRGAL